MATDQTHHSILLMSNASCDVFPDNKPHHFTVRLASPLHLTGKWECGMSVILYPNKWLNIRTATSLKYCWQMKNKTTNHVVNVEQGSLLRPGYFESIASLVQFVNRDIEDVVSGYMSASSEYEFVKAPSLTNKVRTHPKFNDVELPYFDYVNDATKIAFVEGQVGNFKIKIESGKDVIRALGYRATRTEITEALPMDYYPSLSMNFPALFVYTPILSQWCVGDTAAPLLALVPIHGKYNHYGENEPTRLHYREVSQSYISEIEIKIVDVHGKEVKFGDGIVALELDFRRVS